MINKPTYAEVKSQRDLCLADITTTVQENAKSLKAMYNGLNTMFTGYGSRAKIFYLLRAAVYQKNGYSYISGQVKRALCEDFAQKNPKAVAEASYAIQKATGLRLTKNSISRAIDSRIKESVDRYALRNAIMAHTDAELEKILGQS